jgi:predicted regulator of Ras-like GTPase activity (Roadblock/LC7/MglB family)
MRQCAEAIFTGVSHRARFKNRNNEMANIKQSLDELLTVDGAMCAAVVDSASGMMLGSAGSGVDLEVAAAGNTEVVRAKLKTMRQLGLNDVIDDMLITLGKQYHIIRPVSRKEGVFVYYVLDKSKSNLALARRKAQDVERELTV